MTNYQQGEIILKKYGSERKLNCDRKGRATEWLLLLFYSAYSTYCFKEAVQANTVGFKNFLIALPAMAIAFGLKFTRNFGSMLIDRFSIENLSRQHRDKLNAFVKYGAWTLQGFVTLLLIVTILMGLSGLTVIEAKSGEVYGAILAVSLTVWLEVLLFRQVRTWRQSVEYTKSKNAPGDTLAN